MASAQDPAAPAATVEAPAATPTAPPQPAPSYNRSKNLKYWLRCVRTLLPTDYQTNDLNRTALAFFCVCGLDLLGELGTTIKPEERQGWIDWFYHCQMPTAAGFRGSPATDIGAHRNAENELYDVGNLPSTYLSLAALVVLGDDLSRVDRKATLEWLASLQRDDGSFREYDGADDGGAKKRDLRFVYCAAAVRYILRGNEASRKKLDEEGVKDIDVDMVVKYIRSAEAYDHGLAASPGLESHAGYTYCGIGALSLLGRLHPPETTPGSGNPIYGLPDPDGTIHWLVSRQRDFNESFSDDEEEKARPESGSIAGINGRCNKSPDSCYSFWVPGALDMLKKSHLIDVTANREFLLQKTAHFIGGFGKLPGSPPDVLHSSLATAGLSIYREEGINRVDSELAITLQAKERLKALSWWKGE